ncbi:phage baseplate assembly protein W [Dysgonomonas alginatilytica]|uniref:Phage baseplate assembly protein W n=1 Tax=Dysgonomonas alginatilytica TaxID=1605892 RepID=A0A2V3PN83_9BACT|nr:GPW/gp25 family protein [Dysgonomonas alginatilytica]PXV63765.1 phage baseplate assembly protein W [Dysgonomonas alginatilytica]
MKTQYYKLPIQFDFVFGDETSQMPKCSEKESIDQYIELLLTTCPGEHEFDHEWGCRIWDMDFENVTAKSDWEEKFKGHILSSVQRYEERIKDISLELTIDDVARIDYNLQTTAIKKQVLVRIIASLLSTGEKCCFNYALYLGPLSTQ